MKISECTLSKETQDLLYRYFAAAANLYGVIEIGKLLKIYNSQNEPVSEENFLSFVENMNFKGKYFCVFNQDDIYDDGSETPALEQEILAEYLYFFESLLSFLLIEVINNIYYLLSTSLRNSRRTFSTQYV